jgi:hypothetical protein
MIEIDVKAENRITMHQCLEEFTQGIDEDFDPRGVNAQNPTTE